MTQGVTTIDIKPGQSIGRQTLLRLLSGMESSPEGTAEPRNASSFFLRSGDAPEFLTSFGGEGEAWRRHLLDLGTNVVKSDTGLAGFRLGNRGLVVVPPFPLGASHLKNTWDVDPLAELLQAEFTVGVVLLRLGRFSVAVYQGSKVGFQQNRCPLRQRPSQRRRDFPAAIRKDSGRTDTKALR